MAWAGVILSSLIFAAASVLVLALLPIVRQARFSGMMRSIASDFALYYTRPVIFRPPSVGGFYLGRHMAIDVVDDDLGVEHTRVRVFHGSDVSGDFSVLRKDACGGGTPNVTGDPGFDGIFCAKGADLGRIRKYLNAELRSKAVEAGIPFTVGRHHVSYMEKGMATRRDRIVAAMDLLAQAAARADKFSEG